MALLQSTGKVTYLRVNDVGTGYGPATDFIDAEVIFQLNHDATKAFGFQLRPDNEGPCREGMLEILRDAFNHDWTVTTDYDVAPGRHNGLAIRVGVAK